MIRSDIALVALAAVTLCACATTAGLREGAPDIEAKSSKNARAVSACITERWQASGAFGLQMDVRSAVLQDGYSLSVESDGRVQLLADIRDIEGGSTTMFYKPGFVMATGKFEAAARDCQ